MYECISHFDLNLCPTTVVRYLCHYTGRFKFKTSQMDLSITFLIIDWGNLKIFFLLVYHHHRHHQWLTLDGKPPATHAKLYFNQCKNFVLFNNMLQYVWRVCIIVLYCTLVQYIFVRHMQLLFKLLSIICIACIACIHWKSCIVKYLIAYCRQTFIESRIWCSHIRSSICTWTNRETATKQPLAC